MLPASRRRRKQRLLTTRRRRTRRAGAPQASGWSVQANGALPSSRVETISNQWSRWRRIAKQSRVARRCRRLAVATVTVTASASVGCRRQHEARLAVRRRVRRRERRPAAEEMTAAGGERAHLLARVRPVPARTRSAGRASGERKRGAVCGLVLALVVVAACGILQRGLPVLHAPTKPVKLPRPTIPLVFERTLCRRVSSRSWTGARFFRSSRWRNSR